MEEKKKIKFKTIFNIVFIAIVLIVGYSIYKKYNFNNFTKAEHTLGIAKFERDSTVKVAENSSDSYKIINNEYNDAMFYETVNVVPNTSYKVTCKIKTQNVQSKNENTDSGAHICIANSIEKSDNVTGTSDWTDVTFYFNSKNKTQVDVGFRLGGFEDDCIGTAWFSDFKMETGTADTSNTWNYLFVLFDYVDTTIEGKNVKLTLSSTDKNDMFTCMQRFQNSMKEMSGGKMNVKFDVFETKTPITHFSYDEENGYFVSGYDVKEVLDPYIAEGKYDHIFIAFRTDDVNQKGAIPTNDWIGLGSMEYRNLGFSNIRLPESSNDYLYKYDTRVNTFPEEVLVHEFLHTLERNSQEYGEERPNLHDNEKYGYKMKQLIGLREWYQDYINKDIKTTSEKIGLPQDIYTKKPAKSTDFTYSREANAFKEPENIIEEINMVCKKVKNLFTIIQKNKLMNEEQQ